MKLPAEFRGRSEWLICGPLPQGEATLTALPTMAIDGGANFAARYDVWVGDADSLVGEIKTENVFKHPAEKDRSDLGLGLSLFEDPLHYKLHLKGFLGGRRDHEWFNVGEVLAFLDCHSESHVLMYDETGRHVLDLLGAGSWNFKREGLFSVGALKKTRVGLRGDCKYAIDNDYLGPLSSFGLSNEGFGLVALEAHGPVFVYYPEGT